MTDQITMSREMLRQVLKAFEVATTPIEADRQEVLAAIAALREALEQPAVEPVPLTTEEYTALAHRIASKYAHRSDPKHIAYTFLPHTLEQFVRAIEQAVRRKAGL